MMERVPDFFFLSTYEKMMFNFVCVKVVEMQRAFQGGENVNCCQHRLLLVVCAPANAARDVTR